MTDMKVKAAKDIFEWHAKGAKLLGLASGKRLSHQPGNKGHKLGVNTELFP